MASSWLVYFTDISDSDRIVNINPLDWHGNRILDFIPDHFTTLMWDGANDTKAIDWIIANTSGRFGFAKEFKKKDGDFFVISRTQIGFEIEADATMFSMFYQ